MPTKLVIIGAGGHAKVVVEAIQSGEGNLQVKIVHQDKDKQATKLFGSIPVDYLQSWLELPLKVHVAIGDNKMRQQLGRLALENGKEMITVFHPVAQVSPSASIDSGCFVAANAVIAAQAKVHEGCIVNHGAVIDHDCSVGFFCHIGPNATLGGGARIGSGSFIGSGATVLPEIKIGSNVIVGAGSVVRTDVEDNQVVVGVPARLLRENE